MASNFEAKHREAPYYLITLESGKHRRSDFFLLIHREQRVSIGDQVKSYFCRNNQVIMCPGLGAAQQKLRPSRTRMARSLQLSLQMSIRSKIIVQCYNSRFIKNFSYFNIMGNSLWGLKLPLAVSLEMKDIVLVVYRLKCTNRDWFLIASPVLSRNVIFQSARCPMM